MVKEKSHKGQRKKGCGLCDTAKRAGNAAERRPFTDRKKMVDSPVRAMYRRLAAEYDQMHATVPDCRGSGVTGDLSPF